MQNDSLTNSSAASTASESELVMEFETFSTSDLKEFGGTKKPKRKKKQNRKRRPSIKHQTEPDSDALGKVLLTFHANHFHFVENILQNLK